jgi:hypothetical protein
MVGTLAMKSEYFTRKNGKNEWKELVHLDISYLDEQRKKEELCPDLFPRVKNWEIRDICYKVLGKQKLRAKTQCKKKQWKEINKEILKLQGERNYEYPYEEPKKRNGSRNSDRILNPTDSNVRTVWIQYDSENSKEEALALIFANKIVIEPVRIGTCWFIIENEDIRREILKGGEPIEISRDSMKYKTHKGSMEELKKFSKMETLKIN